MKPIAVFRHAPTEGPGYLAAFLDRHKLAWKLVSIDGGDAVPESASAYSGLVFMGGPMSVNDALPWIPPVLDLIRDAYAKDIPLLGHCLGGQLMSRALGGIVSRNPVKEIGWGEVTLSDNEVARKWFGDIAAFQAFHWHGETFSRPSKAIHLLSSRYCVNQAWAIGRHLAMQCHIEMTPDMIGSWCDVGATEVDESRSSPGVQSVSEMMQGSRTLLPPLNDVAEHVYDCWIRGLAY